MGRGTDVVDIAFFLRFQSRLIGIVHFLPVGDEMQLEKIYIVRTHPLQGEGDMLRHRLPVPGLALRGEDDILPHVGKGLSYLLLGIRVGVRRIEIADAPFIRPAQDRHRIVYGAALDRQCPKGRLRHEKACLA